jgi:uncharacterized phiE125 gp8 family phage protein
MPIKTITAPTSEPVTLLEAKMHCRVIADPQDAAAHPEDAYLTALIVAARQAAEQMTGRALMTQTLEIALDEFPDEILLPRSPVASVTSVKYLDLSGVLQTLSSDDYVFDDYSTPPRIYADYHICWPAVRDQRNSVLVRYVAGYASAALVPQEIKSWMLLRIGMLYENRESVIAGVSIAEVPHVDRLLDAYRVWGA